MGFKQFLLEVVRKRGFILPNGKVVDLDQGEFANVSHSEYASNHLDSPNPEIVIEKGGVRLVYNGDETLFEFAPSVITASARGKTKRMMDQILLSGGRVALEKYSLPDWDSDFERIKSVDEIDDALGLPKNRGRIVGNGHGGVYV